MKPSPLFVLIWINGLGRIRQSFVKITCLTKRLALLALVAAPLSASAAVPQIPESETLLSLVLMADREQAVPMSKFASEYSQGKYVSIATAFNYPDNVMEAIADGEQCDVYLSSYPGITEMLTARGLADVYAATPLRQEKLVLAASKGWWKEFGPKNWPKKIQRGTNLSGLIRTLPDARLIIGEPTRVASGRYASDMLQKQRWQVPLAALTTYTASTAGTLQRLIQPGMVGFVYASDLENQPQLVAISDVANNLTPPMWLQGNVIAGERMSEARKLLDYLKRQEAARSETLTEPKPKAR